MSSYMTFPVFVVAFAAIIFWLVNRGPVESETAQVSATPEVEEMVTVTPTQPVEDEVIALSDNAQHVRNDLHRVIIPVFYLKNVPLEDAIDAFRLGFRTNHPDGYGLSFIIRHKLPGENNAPDRSMDFLITIDEKNLNSKKALDLICRQAGYRWEIGEHAIVLTLLD